MRSQAMARSNGVELSGLRARRFVTTDFDEFDYLIGMDDTNMANMLALRPDDSDIGVNLMLEYSNRYEQREVPDPYFGEDGFDLVFDMIDDAARGLLSEIRTRHGI